jgi:hypothetical protein
VSEAFRTLSFQHRFASGALCKIVVALEQAKTNTFRPHFVWNGRSCKRRELVRWIVGVFQIVSTRSGVPMGDCFPREDGSENVAFRTRATPAKARQAV